MFYGKLQPKRATLVIRVVLLSVGALGVAATASFAGMAGIGAVQAPADTPPSSSKEKPQIPPSSSGQTRIRSPLQMSGKGKESAKAAQAGSAKASTPGAPSTTAGRRDPFKAWVAPTPASRLLPEPGALPAGTKGLVISGLRLEGIVREQVTNTMIAVVTNYTKRAYFLRVGDAVYNGVVSKITPEAIYFKETTLDSRGRVTAHEVEVKLGSAPGEGR